MHYKIYLRSFSQIWWPKSNLLSFPQTQQQRTNERKTKRHDNIINKQTWIHAYIHTPASFVCLLAISTTNLLEGMMVQLSVVQRTRNQVWDDHLHNNKIVCLHFTFMNSLYMCTCYIFYRPVKPFSLVVVVCVVWLLSNRTLFSHEAPNQIWKDNVPHRVQCNKNKLIKIKIIV